ncbi:tRNA methyltransferase 1 [Brevipalpus obovatus]|uniref:tRNA methyltransferase 1 n=1 Tax=Brevipalpus obovatus TaxID=246614 RepID=UPI003D9EDBCA
MGDGLPVTINEGNAVISSDSGVFYNPVQEFNRDLSVFVLDTYLKHKLWEKGSKKLHENNFKLCEALSATGLRCIRYALELENKDQIKKLVANDISPKAVETIRKNVTDNKCQEKIEIVNEDASLLLYKSTSHNDRFFVIDIDPYGSAAPFIDSAVQAICDGGLLMVTCTDVAILCGNAGETCFAKYGAMSLRLVSCHEMALRIVLHSIESSATRYGKYILPLLSVSVDFYVRIFVQVFQSPSHAKFSASKRGLVYNCTGCSSFSFQRLGSTEVKRPQSNNIAVRCKFSPATGPTIPQRCQTCDHAHAIGGPIYLDPIHSQDFLTKLKDRINEFEEKNLTDKLGTFKRIKGMIEVISEELPDVPLFYCSDLMAQKIHGISPPAHILRSALLNAGYRVSISHCHPTSLKTDAPNNFLWDIFKEWAKKSSCPNENKLKKDDIAKSILQKPTTSEISFSIHSLANPASKNQKLLRFQVNPPFWGPKSRAKEKSDENEDKKLKSSHKETIDS